MNQYIYSIHCNFFVLSFRVIFVDSIKLIFDYVNFDYVIPKNFR